MTPQPPDRRIREIRPDLDRGVTMTARQRKIHERVRKAAADIRKAVAFNREYYQYPIGTTYEIRLPALWDWNTLRPCRYDDTIEIVDYGDRLVYREGGWGWKRSKRLTAPRYRTLPSGLDSRATLPESES